ncbi:zinc finger protein [Holotrichia oblita]|uniref:Zinc finger protein n=1 Tax=Holotrichia oblita TaxID=644536 RepID=A0ACB9TVK8_HOLOL|nr:zinc finger protein [Holotrichia oblita]
MAAVIDMGEVDEAHSKEEAIKDEIILNGDVSSIKSLEEENESVSNQDVMDVHETQESDENDIEATSIEIDDEDSNESNEGSSGDKEGETHINNHNKDEVHSVDNSEDEIDEVVDADELRKEDIKFKDVTVTSTTNNDKEKGEKYSDHILLETNEKEKDDSILLNDSGDGDVEIIESDDLPKENGKSFSPISNEPHRIDDDDDDDDVITLDTPVKKIKKSVPIVDSPRRSARNLNKKTRKSYIEKENDESSEEESDIEEVMPQDPLAVADPLSTPDKVSYTKKQSLQIPVSSTIVVKDTKRLVEIASKSTPNNSGKKEPTLVIIDTNSILSGRGPIPVNQKSTTSQSFPVLPMALPAQGVYPPNMRATITPIPPINSSTVSSVTSTHSPIQKSLALQTSSTIQLSQLQSPSTSTPTTPQNGQQQQSPSAPILPSLTDDMFVVEAPSFIVPYVYEKPPVKDLKEFVDNFAKELKEQQKAEEKEKLEAEERQRLLDEQKEKEVKEQNEKETNDTDEDSEKVSQEKTKNECEISNEKNTDESDKEEKKVRKCKDEIESEALDKNTSLKTGEDKLKNTDIKIVENSVQESKIPEKKEFSYSVDAEESTRSSKPYSYFESPLGKFFIDIGHSLVQEFVQSDLLKQQKRKREREGGKNVETNKTITSLIKNLEYTKENNEPYHMPIKKCEFCSFKTESALAMAFHLETPHMKNFVYRCNFCAYEIRSPHDILFHMEAEHMIRGRLERAPAFHQCPNCPFEDNQKGKLSRHLVACSRKFKPERNLEPPLEWEPPAKIPRVPRMKQSNLTNTAAMYQAMAKTTQYQLMQKMQSAQSALNRGRGRPSLGTLKQPTLVRNPAQNMIYKTSMSGGSVLLPTNYQLTGNQLYQQQGQQKTKPMHQPSISITPLPRNTSAPQMPASKPGDSNSKNSFVICEICDGYIKDLEQLRNHMQWIHKVKIHPKMIYNRPPLNCQKCQFRFFTDQGLERHLLGSHGLVTSSMQEAANKSKDSGRCPVCGRVYQWKLLNHVARDHNMTLKPAHLSYKCTVCTATFGMYKQFENHVYSAHSVVAKRVMDKKSASPQTSSNSSTAKNDSLLKPLKINDEITIIPQLPKTSQASTSKEESSSSGAGKNSISVTTAPTTSKISDTNSEGDPSRRLREATTTQEPENHQKDIHEGSGTGRRGPFKKRQTTNAAVTSTSQGVES